jgi:hypothetical protein
MEKHIKTKVREEENFIIKLETILLEQIKIFAMSNRDKFSYVEEFRAKKFIERVVFNEIDFLLDNPQDYYDCYIDDDE